MFSNSSMYFCVTPEKANLATAKGSSQQELVLVSRHLQLQTCRGCLGDAEGRDFVESGETAASSAQPSPAILLSYGNVLHDLAVPPATLGAPLPNPATPEQIRRRMKERFLCVPLSRGIRVERLQA